ncbi:AbrB family transcriptional regulator [Lactiplantibacillus plajomi]|uniref:AbrB family transcriptional regulator n=1 Tax=Lactiplantibacillus plajomi TaxID=1457217 RepID=A0ABV6K2N5_9LACO|nr:AbrB family transcriptional regulator [Lactiplantibacillus plajomi]
MINPADLNQKVKMFKNGNSYAFRISKKDREFLGADTDTRFEKIVSPDGKEITFKKIEKLRPDVLKTATQLYEKHSDLMKRLEDL